jgi:hexosaminidase
MRLSIWIAVSLAVLPVWAADHNPLLPRPQEVSYGSRQLPLRGLQIRISSSTPTEEDRFAAAELSQALSMSARARIPVATTAAPGPAIVLTRTGDGAALPAKDEQPGPGSREAYTVTVTPAGAELRAGSSAGLFYAVQTMRQLVENIGPQAILPEVKIRDWPSFAYRGFMMDTSHGPLPTESEIERQIDFLVRWKANQYYFYSEASIEVKGYPQVNPGARYSQEQIKRIIAYARERHVDVVPCLEYFGHLHDVFRVEKYSDLSLFRYGGDLNPSNPKAVAMVEDWVGQMAELFPSPWFHVGLDEPWELELYGAKATGSAPGALYLDHLKKVVSMASKRGKRVLFWADMLQGARIFSRYPELVAQLPADVVVVPWHYRADNRYEEVVAPLAKAKVPTVVASGIWNWNEVAPSFEETFGNISGLLEAGRRHGAIGFLNTGWTDDSQVIYRMSLPAIAYGAAAPWQSVPMDRKRFFFDYARLMYGTAAADSVGKALEALTVSQETFRQALGGGTMVSFWKDPFEPANLARLQEREKDLRRARLAAGEALEKLSGVMDRRVGPDTVSSLWLAARMLDYLGMRSLFAVEIAGYFRSIQEDPRPERVNLLLQGQTVSEDHSLVQDLMDASLEIRDLYRQAWLAEYRSYRLGAVLGRWDAEYEYWRRMQTTIGDAASQWKPGTPPPSLDAVRPKR